MIQLLIAGQYYLDLYPDTKIRLSFNNPAFDEELQSGSFSLPFTLPATSKNKRILLFANSDHNTAPNYFSLDCQVFIDTIYFFSGVLYFTAIRPDEFEADLSIDIGPYATALGEKTLRASELNLGNFTLPRDTFPYKIANRLFIELDFPDTSDFDTFLSFATTNSAGTSIIDQWDNIKYNGSIEETLFLLASRVQSFTAGVFIGSATGRLFTAEPVPSGTYVALVFRKVNLDDSSETTTIIPLSAKDAYFLYPLSGEYDDFVLPLIQNKKFYGDKNPVWNNPYNYLNDWIDENELHHNVGANYYTLVPMLKLFYVLSKIKAMTNYRFEGNFFTDLELQKLIIFSNFAQDKIASWGSEINGFDEYIDYVNHLPSTRIKDFLAELGKMFAMYYSLDLKEKKCRFIFKKDLLKAEIVDMTEKAINDFEISLEEPSNVKLQFSDDLLVDDGSGNVDKLNPLTIGNYKTQKDYTLEIGTLPKVSTNPDTLDVNEGTSNFFQLSNEMKLRLLFWRGWRDGSYRANNYAGASDTYALTWNGTKGLYNQFHKDWIQFIQTSKPYKRKIKLSLADLLNLDMNKRLAINFEVYVIKSFEIEISHSPNSLQSPAEFTLVKQA